MSKVFEVDPRTPDTSRAPLAAAAGALATGQLVALPTDTVYGIAARPDDPSATARVFSAKRRPSDLNLPVLTATAEAAWDLGIPDGRATRLAAAFWPGPLTMVLPRSDRSRPWELGERRASIALRVPDLELTSSLLAMTGALAVTSANLSGQPPLSGRDELVATFGDSVAVYLLVARGVPQLGGNPSTVVDLTGEAVHIVRAGPIPPEGIEAAAGQR